MATDVYLYWIQYGNIEIRVEASDAVGSSYGIVILIVKLSRQNSWEQKNHLKPNPKAQTDAGIEVWTMEETEQKEFIPDRMSLQGWTPEQEKWCFFYHIHFVLPFSNSGYCLDEHIQNKKIMKYI